jgi:hypothetical protein
VVVVAAPLLVALAVLPMRLAVLAHQEMLLALHF